MTAVFLLDANVLVALTSPAHIHHGAAHHWLADSGRPAGWMTTPVTESALLRLACNPAVMGTTVRPADALAVLAALRAQDGWHFLPDDATLAEPVIDTTVFVGHRQVTDLHLVNLAAIHGVQLATFDAKLPAALATADRRHVLCLQPS